MHSTLQRAEMVLFAARQGSAVRSESAASSAADVGQPDQLRAAKQAARASAYRTYVARKSGSVAQAAPSMVMVTHSATAQYPAKPARRSAAVP